MNNEISGFWNSLKHSSVFLLSESRLDVPLVPRGSQTYLPSTDPIYSIPILVAGGLFFLFIFLTFFNSFYVLKE